LKAEFSTSLLLLITHQFSVSHDEIRNHSNMLILCSKNIIIFNVENSCVPFFFSKILWWI